MGLYVGSTRTAARRCRNRITCDTKLVGWVGRWTPDRSTPVRIEGWKRGADGFRASFAHFGARWPVGNEARHRFPAVRAWDRMVLWAGWVADGPIEGVFAPLSGARALYWGVEPLDRGAGGMVGGEVGG
jgi:hypothetical protein